MALFLGRVTEVSPDRRHTSGIITTVRRHRHITISTISSSRTITTIYSSRITNNSNRVGRPRTVLVMKSYTWGTDLQGYALLPGAVQRTFLHSTTTWTDYQIPSSDRPLVSRRSFPRSCRANWPRNLAGPKLQMYRHNIIIIVMNSDWNTTCNHRKIGYCRQLDDATLRRLLFTYKYLSFIIIFFIYMTQARTYARTHKPYYITFIYYTNVYSVKRKRFISSLSIYLPCTYIHIIYNLHIL